MNGKDSRPPIAVFAYNRPDKLGSLLSTLQRCNGFAESTVIIHVDGPKRPSDNSGVEAVRSMVLNLRLPNVAWSFQETNRGLRKSIFSGVSEAIEKHGRVIVLEDDLVLSPISLDYFKSALEYYESVQRVWSIAGYMYDAPSLRNSSSVLTLPFAHPWGWATWERAWHRFEIDDRPSSDTLGSQSFKAAFDMNGVYPFSAQLKNSIEGRVNSWFIHWYYTVFKNGGVSIFPPRRLIDNLGLNKGSHGGALNPQDRLVKRPRLLQQIPNFGDGVAVDYPTLDALRKSRELQVQRFIARAGSAKRTLKSLR